ncbi:RpiB/LacA/LacB family sugar-phosphate isomerase [Patescibacteria group bacterium]|nr:RpiB/LacA/LacB family sugar-phosphate isomerase [Patescibacteria group bacterium]
MKLFIATDHGGYELKESLKPFLTGLGHEVEDCGAFTFDKEDDYPDFITPCAEKVAATPGSMGIIIGGSGQGEAMAANRVKGARAAVFYGEPTRKQTDSEGKEIDMIASTRDHNDANILSLGARFLTEEEIRGKIEQFLATPFSNHPRHQRRINKF